MEGSVDLETG